MASKEAASAEPTAPDTRAPLHDEDAGVKFTHDSECEIARVALAEMESGGEPFVFDRGNLWRFDETSRIWHVLPVEEVQAKIADFDGESVLKGVDGKTGEPKIARLKVAHQLMVACGKIAAVECRAPGFFDDRPDGLAFANGFVRVTETGQLMMEPLTPAHRVTTVMPVEVNFDAPEPEMFLWFLNDTFQGATDKADRIRAIQEFVGAALVGRATTLQRMILFLGEGGNGKSVLQTVIEACFPPDSVKPVSPKSLSCPYQRAELKACRLATMTELPGDELLESDIFKALVTGGYISARPIREAPIEFKFRGAIVASANELPAPRDLSDGFFRRFLIIRFERAPEEPIPDLAEQLVQLELSQIIVWGLRGASTVLTRGKYVVPSSAEEASREWRLDSNQVLRFVQEACLLAPLDVASTTGADVYKAYVKWTDENGHAKLSSTKFGKRVKACKVVHEKKEHAIVYGLKLLGKYAPPVGAGRLLPPAADKS